MLFFYILYYPDFSLIKMSDMKCLVCFKNCLPNVKFEATENDFDVAEACHSVNRQLKTIFLLRKFLGVPEYLCWEFLQDYGNPCDWINCCPTCSILVDDAKRIFDKITLLRKKYKNLQRKLKTAVMRSLKSEERGHLGVTVGAMRRIRNFIRNETGIPLAADIPPVRERTQFSTIAESGSCVEVDILPARDGTPDSSVFENFENAEEAPESSIIESIAEDTTDDSLEHYCTICDRNFRSDLLLENHKQKNHAEDIPAGEEAVSEDFPTKLATTKKVKEKTKNICGYCAKEFSCPSHLKRHQPMHTGEKPFLCATCGKGFRNTSHLKAHIRNIHAEQTSSSGEYSVDDFSEQGIIETHKDNIDNTTESTNKRNRNPENSTNVITKLSKRPFKAKRKKKVAKEKNHPCGTCGKIFNCQSHLDRHVRTHTGEKPYLCNTCGRSFGHLSHLKSHLMLHEGIKPHKCTFCDRTFSKKSNMRSHLKVHNRENSEECGTR